MAKKVKNHDQSAETINFPAPVSPEDAEKTCIALATNLVMERLINKTATSQETTFFLKLASQKEKTETELAKVRVELEKAKTEQINQAKKNELIYQEALNAFKGYSGKTDEDEDDEEY